MEATSWDSSGVLSERNMEELEKKIQKNIVSFCDLLPNFVNKWRRVLQEAKDPTRAMVNFSEQIRHIKNANMKSVIDNFEELQTNLETKILIDLEDEIAALKKQINDLNLLNQDLKNNLSNLEKSTIDINWENDSILLRGSATQPPLCKMLQMGYDFYVFFANILNNIKDSLNGFVVYKEDTVKCLENAVNVDVEKKENYNNVTYLLALTQYINNTNIK